MTASGRRSFCRQAGVIAALCERTAPGALLVCTDDPSLAEVRVRTPGAVGFARDDVTVRDGRLDLSVEGTTWPVGRDAIGASQLRALSDAAHVGRLLGLTDAAVGAFLAG